MDGRYPYRETPEGGECYDLARDPGERENLAAGRTDHPCHALEQALFAWLERGRREGRRVEIDPEVVDQLEALGYVPQAGVEAAP